MAFVELPVSASCFSKEAASSAVIQARIPAMEKAHTDKPWIGVLRKLTQLEYM